jgi:DNA polymerase-3 subunit delta'
MQVSEPLGHGQAVRGLWRASAAGRLGHALGFFGARGSGRFAAAVWFANGLLCHDLSAVAERADWAPCGRCPACKQIRSGGEEGNHPDLLVIDPLRAGWSEIPVHAVAERSGREGEGPCLGTFLTLRPAQGHGRVVIVREAERLNLQAQNALLKTLEEPNPGTTLVLECGRPEALLETIHSRLLAVRLAPLSAEQTRAVLERLAAEDPSLAAADRQALAALAAGAPGEALRLHRSGALELLALLGQLCAGADPLPLAAAVWETPGEFEGGTALARDRERARLVLELGRDAFARALRGGGGAESAGVHDALDALAGPLAEGVPPSALRRGLEHWLAARRDIDTNLDPGATVERALLAAGGQLARARRRP